MTGKGQIGFTDHQPPFQRDRAGDLEDDRTWSRSDARNAETAGNQRFGGWIVVLKVGDQDHLLNAAPARVGAEPFGRGKYRDATGVVGADGQQHDSQRCVDHLDACNRVLESAVLRAVAVTLSMLFDITGRFDTVSCGSGRF